MGYQLRASARGLEKIGMEETYADAWTALLGVQSALISALRASVGVAGRMSSCPFPSRRRCAPMTCFKGSSN